MSNQQSPQVCVCDCASPPGCVCDCTYPMCNKWAKTITLFPPLSLVSCDQSRMWRGHGVSGSGSKLKPWWTLAPHLQRTHNTQRCNVLYINYQHFWGAFVADLCFFPQHFWSVGIKTLELLSHSYTSDMNPVLFYHSYKGHCATVVQESCATFQSLSSVFII